MKHSLILFTLILTSLTSMAQTSLNILEIFGDKYRKSDNATETIVSGEALKGTDLKLYRSLVLTDMADAAPEISKAVTKDGVKAVSREVKYVDGQLYYAQFMLTPSGGDNRYIFYVNHHLKGGNKIMLVYMRGPATLQKIKQLIRQ